MKHFKSTISFFLFFLTLTMSEQAVALLLVSGNWDITNNSDRAADNFHIEFRIPWPGEPGTIQVEEDFFDDGIFGERKSSCSIIIPDPECINVFLDWTNADPEIAIGDTIHIGYEFQSDFNGQKIIDAYWTLDDGDPNTNDRNPGEQPKIPGFQVTELSASSYTVFNDTEVDLTIEDLQFLITPARTDLQDMIPFTLPGFGPSQSAFTLAPGASMDFNPGVIHPNDFLLSQLNAYPTADPTYVTRVMYQHQSVAEPSSLVLLGLGTLLLIGSHWYRGRAVVDPIETRVRS